MWWLLSLIVVALIVGMVVALNRRGQGEPTYQPNDPRRGEHFGGPGGQSGPGPDGGWPSGSADRNDASSGEYPGEGLARCVASVY